jgi:HEAT repeat protein
MLRHERAEVRALAAIELARVFLLCRRAPHLLGNLDAAEQRSAWCSALLAALGDVECDVRDYAALALAQLHDAAAIEPLVAALQDVSSIVRGQASNALAAFGSAAVPRLLRALRNADARVRAEAADALGDIADPRAVEPLLRALSDHDVTVRVSVAHALASLGDERALPALRWVADHDDDRLCDEGETVHEVALYAVACIAAAPTPPMVTVATARG